MDGKVGCSYIEFAAKFCNELDKTKNCLFSPLMAAETILYSKALKDIVHDEKYPKGVHISIENNIPVPNILLSYKLKSLKAATTGRAIKIYLDTEHYKLDKKLKKRFKQVFATKITNIDFSNTVGAVEHINNRVEKKSKGKIRGYIKYTDLDVDTNIVLVNGLYIKGHWYMRFDPESTEETIFNLNNNEIVNVFLMNRVDKYNYKDCSDLDSQLLLLPFKCKEVHMLIVLPNRITGLDGVLQKLVDGYDLMREVEKMSNYVDVDVSIPRFKIESEINVVEVLRKLGVTTLFDKVLQKVVIEVNEEGSEPKPVPCNFIPRWKPRPIKFTADHPHLIVVIYENIPIIWVAFRGRFE